MKRLAYTLIAAAMMLTACKSTKTIQGTSSATQQQSSAQIQQPAAPRCLSAKVNIDIYAMGNSMSFPGKIQMRYGEVIRLTIVPYGLMEAVRMELTPDHVLLINRLEKEYVKASYQEFNAISKTPIDFYLVQEYLWNGTFVQGKNVDFGFDLPGNRGRIDLGCTIGKTSTDCDFDSQTTLSDRYRQVQIQEILSKLTN